MDQYNRPYQPGEPTPPPVEPLDFSPEPTITPQEEMPPMSAKEELRQKALARKDEMTSQARQKAAGMLQERKSQAASLLDDVTTAIRQSAAKLNEENHPQASHYVERACDQVERFSHTLRDKDATYFIDRTTDFARRRPGLFIGGALALGFVAFRFLKSSSPEQAETYPGTGMTTETRHDEISVTSGAQYTV